MGFCMNKRLMLFLVPILFLFISCSDTLEKQLLNLEYVTSVKPLEIYQLPDYKNTPVKEKYLICFKQPVDWQNPDGEQFEQRVILTYRGKKNINVYEVNGYSLSDQCFYSTDTNEICDIYNGNNIEIEYRFFGKSRPDNLSNESTEYWEYLTSKNASNDFNRIITSLNKVLKGKKAFTGRSKGGEATNAMAMYYPDCVDAYISFVSPYKSSTNDKNLYKYFYEEIGDKALGKEEAKRCRDLITDFQIQYLQYRDYIKEPFFNNEQIKDCKFLPTVNADNYYDIMIMDIPGAVWMFCQYYKEHSNADIFDYIEQCLDYPESQYKYDYMLNLLIYFNNYTSGFDISDNRHFPYVVQCQTELGQYSYDYSYLRKAIAEKGLSQDILSIKIQDEALADLKMTFTPQQLQSFKFNPEYCNAIKLWAETTDQTNVFQIYGDLDLWNYSAICRDNSHESHSPALNCYHAPMADHSASINDLTHKDRQDLFSKLDNKLGKIYY